MMQERIGQSIIVENKPGGSGTPGGAAARHARRLHVVRQLDRRRAEPPFPRCLQRDRRLRDDRDRRGPPLVLIADASLPYRSLADLFADAKVEESASAPLARHLACDGAGAAQRARQDRDRRRALSRLGRGRPATCRAAASRAPSRSMRSQPSPTTARCARRDREPAADRTARGADRMQELGSQFRLQRLPALAAPAKTPAPVIAFLNKHLNEWCSRRSSRAAWRRSA